MYNGRIEQAKTLFYFSLLAENSLTWIDRLPKLTAQTLWLIVHRYRILQVAH